MGRSTVRSRAVALGLAAALAGAVHAQPPACSYDELPATARPAADGRWTLLDTAFRLPASFAPSDLVPLTRAGFDDDRAVRAVVIADLAALREAASAAKVPIAVQSAYRSYAYQQRTFAYWVDRQGYDAALRSSARAGHSEHQLGTTLDLRAADGPAPWDLEEFGATPTGRWLRENAWRYGFVMSYPEGAEERTCYAYEPWHWRWVGREMAAEAQRSGHVLRSILWEEP